MPQIILPNPTQVLDWYIAGPWLNNAGVTATFSDYLIGNLVRFSQENQAVTTPRRVWYHSQGGTGIIQVGGRYRGVLCMQGSTTVIALINGMGGLTIDPITDITDLAAGFRNPAWRRVQWLTVNLAMDSGTLDRNTGLMFSASGGAQSTPLWPIAPATLWGGGFGVVGDGAGNWNWEIYGPAPNPAPVIESVSLAPAISDASDWHTFDFVFISGAGGREASFELHIDSEVFLTRNWVAAPLMHTLAAAANRFFPIWQVGTTSGDVMYFGDWEFKMGRFLPDGRELQV